ncbi:MAG: amidohydrolase family protein [Deltaproteobacteria bacterium]|nr:amidohydrolase family protein [Deltaproteobacteria bacterium]
MIYDLIIRGGRIVDGTGLKAYSADLAVRDGRIAKIGRIDESAERVYDATGLIVSPGFIDVHTHYDVQLDWDPLATPSSWHGVTTVMAGNCGFTLAPAKPEDVEWLARMLSRVEGMSPAALSEGLRFEGGGFGDFWGRFEGKVGVNVGAYVGHCAVRRFVMGDDASEREATAQEIEAMQELVRQAMREGAIGFSTSQLDIHVAEDGREVPSNHASQEEIVALCAVIAEFDHGAVEIIPHSFAAGYDEADRKLLVDMYFASGKPVELNPMIPSTTNPMGWKATLDFVSEMAEQGVRLHPMCSLNKLEAHIRLFDTFLLDESLLWRDTLCLPEPERMNALRDPAMREKLREANDDPEGRAFILDFGRLVVEQATTQANKALEGREVGDIAKERGISPLDCFLDLALSEDLHMSFYAEMDETAKEFIKHINREAVANPMVMAGSSDGGAHLATFVGADYTTRLLSEYVPDPLSLEQAIYRLTGMPATVHDLKDRGTLRVGAKADIVCFDAAKLQAGRAYLVEDFPAKSSRYVVDSEGYKLTVVNGQILIEDGKHTGALPGEVLLGA